MTEAEHKTNPMLAKLTLLYGQPSKDANEVALIIAEYARHMEGYSVSELSSAADFIARTRKFKSWPTIGDCIEALDDRRQKIREDNAPERSTAEPYPEWSKRRIAEADLMLASELGRQAAREGWVLSMHDFCRNNRRLPRAHEIGKLIAAARYVDRIAAGVGIEGIADTPPGRALRRMASETIAKRERLAMRVLGEAA